MRGGAAGLLAAAAAAGGAHAQCVGCDTGAGCKGPADGGWCSESPANCKSCSGTQCADCPTGPPTPVPPTLPPGVVEGFWLGYAGSASPDPAPSFGWLFSFPGLTVSPPFNATGDGNIPVDPYWGKYEKRILTQGGGDTSWGDSLYTRLAGDLSQYKKAGYDGVCWDWEKVAADHTTAGFNAFMAKVKAAGLINIVTSTAEGPYVWSAASKDATGIDWSKVDYFVPQLYGASGTLPEEWEKYAQYWTSGANKPNVHNVTFSAIPMSQFLWGVPAGQCHVADQYGGAGCVEWDYSPNVHPHTLA